MRPILIMAIALAAGFTSAQTHLGHGPATQRAAPYTADEPSSHALPAPVPDGHAEVQLSVDRVQILSIKTAVARKGSLTGSIRAPAVIAVDESREIHVHSKLMGWVEELFVNRVGQEVKKGDRLYSLYSQELFAAQQEYLRARAATPDLARAARARMELWDVPQDQVKQIERSGARKAIVFRAPISGTVLDKQILQGHAVDPDMMLYRIADLRQVWALAEVYEYEAPRLDPSGTARILVQGSSQAVNARIDHVYPTVDERTRTIRVRMVLPNPDGALRPGSFATVELPARSSEAVWVPEAAVIDTGVRQVVYVLTAPGRFRPQEVRLGRRGEGKAEILDGLQAGAEVVVSSQFLIDSESRLRGSAGGSAPSHGAH